MIHSGIKSAFGRPYIYLLIISICSAISYTVLLGFFQIRHPELVSLRILSITLFGSWLTVSFVNRVLKQEEEREQQRVKEVAFQELEGVLNSYLDLLTQFYVASLKEYPKTPPNSYHEFFSENYLDEVEHMDFSEPHPSSETPDVPDEYLWMDHAASTLNEYENNISDVISQYSYALDPDTLSELRDISEPPFSPIVQNWSENDIILQDANLGIVRTYNLFRSHGMRQRMNDHLESLNYIISEFDELQTAELFPLEERGAWQSHMSPNPGDARFEPIEKSDTKFFLNHGPPPKDISQLKNNLG